VALLVIDGMSFDQWLVIKRVLLAEKPSYKFDENQYFCLGGTQLPAYAEPGTLFGRRFPLLCVQHYDNGKGARFLGTILVTAGPK